MSLRLISSVLFHLLKHLFLAQTLLAARTTWRMTLVIVMLVVSIVAKLRRIWIFGIHQNFLVACPPMHQARHAHNS